jgi:hypothetical protein
MNAVMTADKKKTNSARIEVLHNTEIIIDTYLQILQNTNRRWVVKFVG